jgi:hypothetical protein
MGVPPYATVHGADRTAPLPEIGAVTTGVAQAQLRASGGLGDDLGGLLQYMRGDGQAERPGGPQVDDEVEGGGLLDG